MSKLTHESVVVENYPPFNRLEIKRLYPVNIFIGENGVGKTRLMQNLYSSYSQQEQVFNPEKLLLPREVFRLMEDGKLDVMLNLLKAAYPGLEVGVHNEQLYFELNGYAKMPADMGSGFMKVYSLLTRLATQPKAMYIESIETDIHHSVLVYLLPILISQAVSQGTQLFMTTQSYDFLKKLVLVHTHPKKGAPELNPEDTMVFRLENHKEQGRHIGVEISIEVIESSVRNNLEMR